jgi:hypothetical protein
LLTLFKGKKLDPNIVSQNNVQEKTSEKGEKEVQRFLKIKQSKYKKFIKNIREQKN